MERKKIDFKLTGVPRTLILPLMGRAAASQDTNCAFEDPHAVALLKSLNYNLNDFNIDPPFSTIWAGMRSLYFDTEVKTYLQKHPHATIVNIGAGLETAFYRVDNGKLTWVDLDIPEVIALRHALLPPPSRVHYIAKSVFDYSWIADVRKFSHDIFLFSAGVFIYFTIKEIKPLFIEMANRLKNSELLFDAIAKRDLADANEMLRKFNITDALLQWGVDEEEIQTWSPDIRLISHHLYTHQTKIENDPLTPFHAYMTKIRFG